MTEDCKYTLTLSTEFIFDAAFLHGHFRNNQSMPTYKHAGELWRSQFRDGFGFAFKMPIFQTQKSNNF